MKTNRSPIPSSPSLLDRTEKFELYSENNLAEIPYLGIEKPEKELFLLVLQSFPLNSKAVRKLASSRKVQRLDKSISLRTDLYKNPSQLFYLADTSRKKFERKRFINLIKL